VMVSIDDAVEFDMGAQPTKQAAPSPATDILTS